MAKKVQLKSTDKEILCYPLTFGFMLDIEDGIIVETKLNIVENGTDLTIEDIREMRVPDVTLLWIEIQKETYPELYDDKGELIPFDDVNESDDKKKV